MLHSIEDVQHVFHDDVNLEFLESFSLGVAWEYHRLYEELKADNRLPDELKNFEFSRRRSGCAVRAIVQAAKKHDVPVLHWTLGCNGQQKLLIKMGRVLLIPEAISELMHRPAASNYKVALANTFGISRQLELDLGDRRHRVTDWSGEVLGVLLHGAAGERFTRRDKMLGGLMLAIPDDLYQGWIARFDLHQLAMFGSRSSEFSGTQVAQQRDEVIVIRKRKAKIIGNLK
ncbi:hypothetical protein PH552_00170 [Rhizobium sp. CNPSo 3968]|uniref:hypothetical protein n=1 Tax=Rhizobium sp. CNPSo 3968 TaxID=3021408 RepID=UPI00254ED105|nr:hypothetical protein [Rhizobium sp. CNPSo 3968]MDK4717762.1 hypothetical protein [Rhizobium sp. CNPSo 3968]